MKTNFTTALFTILFSLQYINAQIDKDIIQWKLDGLSSALSKLMVVVERYPDLKANQNFLELQAQLEGTENRLAVERKRYNDAVRQLNTYIRKILGKFYAGLADVEKAEYFEIDEVARVAPKVKF